MSKPITLSKPASAVVDHADDAAGRAGQDRVLALEQVASVRPPFDCMNCSVAARRPPGWQLARHLVDIAAQDRREIGVDHRRVAAARRASSAGWSRG
jgi:hypothetical protein